MQFDWIRREEALSQLIKVFEENGIRAAFLKGIVWSDIVYQRPFDRSASDIDILISERDALHFHRVMQRAGYRYRDDTHTFAPTSLHITHEMTPIHFKSMCIGPYATSTLKNR